MVTARLDLNADSRRRVDSFLERQRSGYPDDLRTGLFEGRPRSSIISEWRQRLGTTGYSWLDEAEEDQSNKIGPMSIARPWPERLDTLKAFWVARTPAPSSSVSETITSKVRELIPSHTLRQSSLSEAYSLMPQDTNLGLPFFTRDRQFSGDYLRRAIAISRGEDGLYPDVSGLRTQQTGLEDDPKQRLLWLVDHAEVILGKSFQDPLLATLRPRFGFAAWESKDRVDREVTEMLGKPCMSVDFSNFDATLPAWLLDLLIDLIAEWFIPTSRSVYAISALREHFVRGSIITPSGEETGRTGGIPSGSVWTNKIGTLANKWLYHCVAYYLGVSEVKWMGLGDDGVWQYEPMPTSQDVSDVLKEVVGVQVNPDKSLLSTDHVIYLQDHHHRDYLRNGVAVGVRPTFRMLGRAISLERYSTRMDKWMQSVRALLQWEQTRWSPAFRKFVAFLYDGDELLRRFDPSIIFRRGGGVENVESVLNIHSFPYTWAPLDRFDDFSVVRSVREIQSRTGRGEWG